MFINRECAGRGDDVTHDSGLDVELLDEWFLLIVPGLGIVHLDVRVIEERFDHLGDLYGLRNIRLRSSLRRGGVVSRGGGRGIHPVYRAVGDKELGKGFRGSYSPQGLAGDVEGDGDFKRRNHGSAVRLRDSSGFLH